MQKGYSPMGGIPLPFWKGNRLLIYKIFSLIFPLIPLVLTYFQYGFWIAVIVGTVIYMISYGLGYGRIIFLEYKSSK